MCSHFVVTIHRQSYTADGVPANAEIEELVHGGIQTSMRFIERPRENMAKIQLQPQCRIPLLDSSLCDEILSSEIRTPTPFVDFCRGAFVRE
jgi:hypothetical protein